jgi:hypothetical protein
MIFCRFFVVLGAKWQNDSLGRVSQAAKNAPPLNSGGAFQIRDPMGSLARRFGLEGIMVQVARRVHQDNLER